MDRNRARQPIAKFGKRTELAVYLVALVVACAALLEAASLDFYRQHTLGPAVYPSIVLVILFFVAVILIIRLVRDESFIVYSPFPSGAIEHRFLEKFLSKVSLDGVDRIEIVTLTGEGRFSCFHQAARAPADGRFAAVVTSEVGAVGNHYVAQLALKRFDFVCGLFFEPDALVVRASSSLKTSEDLEAAARLQPLHVALTQKIGLDRGIGDWLHAAGVADPKFLCVEDPEHALAALKADEADVAIVPLMALSGGHADDFRCLCVADANVDGASEAPLSSLDFVSGTWAAIVLPKGVEGQVISRLETSFHKAGEQLRDQGDAGELQYSRVLPDNRAFLSLLDRQGRQCDPDASDQRAFTASRDKFPGLFIALLVCAVFSPAMTAFGFAPAAAAFLIILIIVLWPRYEHRIWAIVLPLGAGLAIALHWLFAGVFSIRFPIGQITGV